MLEEPGQEKIADALDNNPATMDDVLKLLGEIRDERRKLFFDVGNVASVAAFAAMKDVFSGSCS